MASRTSPTLATALVAAAVSLPAFLAAALPVSLPPLALSLPLTEAPWTLVTAVYVHWGPGHLAANALGVLLVGPFVARRTTPTRFHAFFLGTGILTGVAEVLAGSLTDAAVAVAGMSGAVFALLGYLLAGNVATRAILSRVDLSPRVQFGAVLAVAVSLTLVTAGPDVALVGHATGLALGLVAGGLGLLDDRGR